MDVPQTIGTISLKSDFVQVAYFVTDIRASALRMNQTLGAGPFYVSENIKLGWAEHRGKPADFVHSSAYGQWGNTMMELVSQVDDSPDTPFRDMYREGEEGIHHMALFVPNINQAIEHFSDQGLCLATRAKTASGGVEFAFIDAISTLGHMIEIYEELPVLKDFYQMVRESAQNWDGKDPVRG